MNRKQLIVARFGVGLILLMCLFPPWRGHVFYVYNLTYLLDTAAGYAFLFSPPERGMLRGGGDQHLLNVPYVDLQLLATQWVIVTALSALVISFLRGTETGNSCKA
jgi:hypothetical protein